MSIIAGVMEMEDKISAGLKNLMNKIGSDKI
jgi:hypothetical protein